MARALAGEKPRVVPNLPIYSNAGQGSTHKSRQTELGLKYAGDTWAASEGSRLTRPIKRSVPFEAGLFTAPALAGALARLLAGATGGKPSRRIRIPQDQGIGIRHTIALGKRGPRDISPLNQGVLLITCGTRIGIGIKRNATGQTNALAHCHALDNVYAIGKQPLETTACSGPCAKNRRIALQE